MNERQKKLLDFLSRHDQWFHGGDLAGLFHVSSRTIRGDIACINASAGSCILAHRQLGYRYDPTHTPADGTLQIYPSSSDRLLFEMKALLVEGRFDLFDMAERLYVSEAAVEADLSHIRKFLMQLDYRLIKLSKHKDDYVITGMEAYRNNLLYELGRFLYKDCTTQVFQPVFPALSLTELRALAEDCIRASGFSSRYLQPLEVTLDLAALLELAQRFPGEAPCRNGDPQDFAALAVRRLQERYQILLGERPVAAWNRKVQTALELDAYEHRIRDHRVINENLFLFYEDIARELREIFHIDLMDCRDIYLEMILHTRIAVQRIRSGYKYYNPLREQILARFPYTIDIVLYLVRRLEAIFEVQFDSNELSFLVAYMGAILGNLYCQDIRDLEFCILLIHFESRSSLMHISKFIKERLGHQKHFIVEIGSHLEYEALAEFPYTYDYVVYAGEHLEDGQQVDLTISNSFSPMDQRLLQDGLQTRLQSLKEEKFHEMFWHYFDRDLFLQGEALDSQEQVISALAHRLEEKGVVGNGFLQSVFNREGLLSTSLSQGVALPHALGYDARETKIAIAILPRPVRWGRHRVRLVFLLASSLREEDRLHLFINFLTEVLSQPDLHGRIRRIDSFDEIRELFRQEFMR